MFINSLLSDFASITWTEDCWAHILGWKNLFNHNGKILGYNKSSAKCIGIMVSQRVLLRLSMPGYVFLCLIWINCKYCIACLHYIGYVECVQMFVYSSVMRGCVYFLVVANICSSRWLQPLRSPNEEWPRNLHLHFLLLNWYHTVPGYAGTHI